MKMAAGYHDIYLFEAYLGWPFAWACSPRAAEIHVKLRLINDPSTLAFRSSRSMLLTVPRSKGLSLGGRNTRNMISNQRLGMQ